MLRPYRNLFFSILTLAIYRKFYSYPLGIDPIALFSYQSSLDIRKKTSDTAHLSSASESGSVASLLLKAVLNLNSEL
jgi:hypothetical protein